jgi:DNA-directed RNA polymerase subunit alpha
MVQEIRDDNPFYKNWHELISPERLEVTEGTRTDRYGRFICQPFERGFAATIGHSLRRILLSSIRGAAIVSVKIDNALHEFTTIDGVHEDVAEIILNLKQVRLKLEKPEGCTVVVEKAGDGKGAVKVTASDINGGTAVEVMNPDQHICTVTSDTVFRAELRVEWGKGYVLAEQNKKEGQAIGEIPIDAIFSPIVKIQYVVSSARVGQRTDYDRLTMEIETDGSVKPENALAYSAKIIKEQMAIFINFDEEVAKVPDNIGKDKDSPLHHPFLDKDVEDLELSVRSANCLKNADIQYIGQLVQKTDSEMLKTKNFGRKSLNEIKALLLDHDLTLGMKIEGWAAPDTDKGEDGEDES